MRFARRDGISVTFSKRCGVLLNYLGHLLLLLLQFTINKIVYKIFGAMSKVLYSEICVHFGIDSVENLIANRRNRFINRYGETDNYLDRQIDR